MRVHAIQTGTVQVTTRQRDGRGGGRTRVLRTMLDRTFTEPLPILAWLIEHPEGLIVVDTGESAGVGQKGWFPWWQPYFRLAVRFQVQPEDEIGPQLRALGFDPDDVRTVVLTHLHSDHAGGIPHFPRSEFVVARGEHAMATGRGAQLAGYLPKHLPPWFAPTLVDGEHTVAEGVRIVPTPGHTPNHQSVLVEDGDRTLFIAGDVSYSEELMRAGAVDGVTQDPQTAAETVRRVRELVDERGATYLASHDPRAAERLEAASS
ncbi:MAG TPA: N-acyl homoserine lactonase family protein [Solirubrobacteraceae bacterium]|nr:N-acyl homoserine lactonase family protein [Solirubrobacteraceae bacterium]